MAANTKLNSSWVMQWVILLLAAMGYGVWSYYDAYVKYPANNARYEQYQNYEEGNKLSQWPSYARSRGWPVEKPKQHSNFDIAWNQGVVILCALFILFGLCRLGMNLRRSFRADEDGFHVVGRATIPYDAITEIDTSRWPSRGIAQIHYNLPHGGARRIKLDAWVFRGTRGVLEEIQLRTGLGDAAG